MGIDFSPRSKFFLQRHHHLMVKQFLSIQHKKIPWPNSTTTSYICSSSLQSRADHRAKYCSMGKTNRETEAVEIFEFWKKKKKKKIRGIGPTEGRSIWNRSKKTKKKALPIAQALMRD